jgi:TatD DNase family protein
MYIDTHAHITTAFYDDISSVVEAIQEAHIEKIINVATSLDEAADVLAFHTKYPSLLYPAMGIHPENAQVAGDDMEDFTKLVELNKDVLVAIGECGLDYKDIKEEEMKEKQKTLFAAQVELSQTYDLPIIIHCRFALDDLIEQLKQYKKPFRGVLHSADGTTEQIQQILDLGFHVSFNGIATFKNADEINDLIEYVPIDRILLETDSPFLAPVPLRGTKNTPVNITYVYDYVANKKKMDIEELQKIVLANAENVFGKKITS